MKRHAIFVDAGYLYAQGSLSLGRRADRTHLKLNEEPCIRKLILLASGCNEDAPLLRVYWYDGARNGPTIDHRAIAEMPNVKLRLGSINGAGQQKEVDSLLVTDLIDLARNQSICDATIVSGDSDLRVAVQIAQTFGVRVHLVGLEPSAASQSAALRQEADTVHEISKTEVSTFLAFASEPQLRVVITPPIPATHLAVPAQGLVSPIAFSNPPLQSTSDIAFVAAVHQQSTLDEILPEAIERTLINNVRPVDMPRLVASLSSSSLRIPQEYDKYLLATCRLLLERELEPAERREMRRLFCTVVLERARPV